MKKIKITKEQRKNIEIIIDDLDSKDESICVGYGDGSGVCKLVRGNEPCKGICYKIFPECIDEYDGSTTCPCYTDLSREEIQKRFRSIL